ncbi:unnamed protein product [Aureobasidium uvarum]|uniref:C2H2-type domain-containing protein n=1 Tax=Aureobasidium uvarum TaxID=2773716 RepID=A0A9N8KH43_9PEZI|nr:unnamed protein product [Aureobasidium uvarum]
MSASSRQRPSGHRRGLSIDQGMTLLSRQEPGLYHMDPNQQHFFRPAFMEQDIASAEQAKQAILNLEQHIQTVYRTYGYVPQTPLSQSQPQMPTTPIIVATRPTTPCSNYQQPMSGHPEGPLLDVSPMPNSVAVSPMHPGMSPMPIQYANVPVVQVQEPYQDQHSVYAESFAGDYACTPSYTSSMADPSSPMRSPMDAKFNPLPTVYEALSPAASHATYAHDSMMLSGEATSNMSYYTDSPQRSAVSPREAMLQTLDIDASIEDTGISPQDVQQYISPQDHCDGKWTCLFDGCGKKFGRKENIRAHVQTHLGDRQFKCNHCGKCFVRQHDLKRHAKIHSGDKPHKCPCGNGFARQDALTRHRQRGVCDGALPGFERSQVRRGRPKKHHYDISERLERAAHQREINSRRNSEFTAYASSSASEASYPNTPAANINDDFDDDDFANYQQQDGKYSKEYRYTAADLSSLPTTDVKVAPQPQLPHSPPPSSQCPSQPFGSSDNTFSFSSVDCKPIIIEENECLSPAATSSVHSIDEKDDFSPNATHAVESAFMGSEDMLEFNPSMYGGPGDSLFNASLDAWLESH